jgi:hypothetical protein
MRNGKSALETTCLKPVASVEHDLPEEPSDRDKSRRTSITELEFRRSSSWRDEFFRVNCPQRQSRP